MPPWTCSNCGTIVEEEFDVCWECGTTKAGVVDPTFHRVEEEAGPDVGPDAVPDDTPLRERPVGAETPPAPRLPPHDVPCPSCRTPLVPIRLVATGERYASSDDELKFATADREDGWVGSDLPVEGRVRARMCPRCRRIDLYALPE